ncbi:MAG: hypothetical protein L3J59_05460 [Methylococcaceae bacterium]|nr:hypothetical protein [Methylococcaceae bacterium]
MVLLWSQKISQSSEVIKSSALSAELIGSSINKNNDLTQVAKVQTIDCRLEGKTIPLAFGLSSLQEELAINPENALNWFRFGNLITKINRPKATIEAYKKSIDHAPRAADAKFSLAVTLADNN